MLKRLRIPLNVCVACCIALTGCNWAKTASEKTAAQKTPAAKGDAEKEVQAALDEAIQAIEKKDMKTFLVKFMPVDAYRELRDEPGGIDVAAKMMGKQFKANPESAKELLTLLRGAREVEPDFNVGKTVAIFAVTVAPADSIKLGNVPLLRQPGDGASTKILGYGDDVTKVVRQAITDLKAGKVGSYLLHMLPESEFKANDLSELESRLKNSPALKQTIHDLKLMQSMQPNMEDNGNVAVFRLPMTGPAYEKGEFLKDKKTHTRTVKLQKTTTGWRLFDNTSPMQTATSKFSGKTGKIVRAFSMEKIGDIWRIYEFDIDPGRSGGRTRRDSSSKTYSVKSAVGHPEPKEASDDSERGLPKLGPDKTDAKTSEKKSP